MSNFNPRSLAGATGIYASLDWLENISIHAPLRERLQAYWLRIMTDDNFNPRSLAGATLCAFIENSIKAYFNPRSLAGATATSENAGLMSAFQSTLPCGSDSNLLAFALRHAISIHAPLRERPVKSTLFTYPLYFNPRSLAGATVCLGR